MVKYGKGEALHNHLAKSWSLNESVPLGYDIHKSFSVFFFLPLVVTEDW